VLDIHLIDVENLLKLSRVITTVMVLALKPAFRWRRSHCCLSKSACMTILYESWVDGAGTFKHRKE